MPEVPAPQGTRDELLAGIRDLQQKAMRPGIPIPQMIALKNRAQELYDQFIELDAARFNEGAADYVATIGDVNGAIVQLRNSVREIDDAIDNLEKAGSVFKFLDKLLKVAVKFAGP